MPIRQKIFALIIGIAIFLFILEMVRRRKLREEYSWLWLRQNQIQGNKRPSAAGN